MPREHKIKLYKYSELSDKAKERARSDWLKAGMAWDSGFDSQMLTDTFKELLIEKGFEKGVEVHWSLGNSQGDGVAFSGTLDIPKYVRERAPDFMRLIGHVSVAVKHSDRYTHWRTMEIGVYEEEGAGQGGPKDWFPGKPSRELVKRFEEYVKADVKDISKELEKTGYAEMEYKESEEYIADLFEANEYEFTEDGKWFHA